VNFLQRIHGECSASVPASACSDDHQQRSLLILPFLPVFQDADHILPVRIFICIAAECKQFISRVLRSFGCIGVIQSISLVSGIDPIELVKQIQNQNECKQVGNTPTLEKITESS